MPIVESTWDFPKSINPIEGYGWTVKIKAGGQEFVMRSQQHERGETGELEDYRIEFRYEWDILPTVGIGSVRLFNIMNPKIEQAFQKGDPIEIYSSWQQREGSALTLHGTIIHVQEYWERSTVRGAEILWGDASELLSAKITSRTWRPGVKYSKVFRDLADDLGLPIRYFKPAVDGRYRTGMAVFSRIWPQMQMVARDMKSKLYCHNREIYVLPYGEGIFTNIEWRSELGLRQLAKGIKLEVDGRYKVRFRDYEPATRRFGNLFDSLMGPDRIFRVYMKKVTDTPEGPQEEIETGLWRAVRGVHYCDWRQYMTEVDAVMVA